MVNKNIRLHPQKRPPHGVLRENRHKNTIFVIALAILLCGVLFCGAAAAEGDHIHPDELEFQPWVDDDQPITDRLPKSPGNYYLTADVTLSDTWTVPEGTTNLCLNGHSISLNTGKTCSVISIGGSAALNLYDCGTTGKITGGKANDDGGGVYVNGGTFNMYGGSITKNTAEWGGGVYVEGGTFNMEGGSITNNNAENGGGVYVDAGTFNMEGGSITNNNAENGGGVHGVRCDFSMSDNASITNNTANMDGGGVYGFTCDFSMSDNASITNNTANKDGGGVYGFKCDFNMSGNASITGNTASQDGGGVYVKYDGTFSMSDNASITGNTANMDGGGVYVDAGMFNMEGGSITNNNAENGGGVYVDAGTFNMNGGSITGNTASQDGGGGVYVKSGTFSVKGNASVMNNSSNNVFLSTSNKLNLTGDLTGTVLVTPGYEGEFGTASNTGDAKHIINETNGMYAVITTEDNPGKLIWSDSAFSGTLITLNWNNGSGKQGKIVAFTNETTSFSIAAPAKTDYTFTGWYLQGGTTLLISTDGTLVKSEATQEYVDSEGKWKYDKETLTLYAGWEVNKTSITYHDRTGETPVEISWGETFVVKTPDSKTGDEFFGWVYIDPSGASKRFTLYDGTNSIYISDSPYYDKDHKWISDEESLDLYALWASSAVPGPSPSSKDMTVSYQEGGASYTLSIPSDLTLTKDGVTQTSISVTNVTVPEGQHVDVTLTSTDVKDDNTTFLLKLTGTNTGEVEYNIARTEDDVRKGQNLIKNNDKVIEEVETDAGKTQYLFFKMTQGPTTAGKYTGTLTFTASVSS